MDALDERVQEVIGMSRRRETTFILVFALALCVCGASAPASAQTGPCAEDAKKLCTDIKPGEGRLVKCLRAHDAELSEACKASVQRDSGVTAKVQPKPVQAQPSQPTAVRAKPFPCEEDAKKFCKDVQPGQGRLDSCLKQHLADISEGCKTTLAAGMRPAKGVPAPAAKGAAGGTAVAPSPAQGAPH